MIIGKTQFKALESVVGEASMKLRDMGAQQNKLHDENERLKNDLVKLREELRTANMRLSRHSRLKERLERLSKKLESVL